MKKNEPKWVGNSHVQTDGKRWQVRVVKDPYIYSSLKTHIEEMQKVLAEHPDAEVEIETQEDAFSTSTYARFCIRWWEDTTEDHPEVKNYLKKQDDRKRWQKEQEDREISALRKKRPELFKEA